MRALTQSDKARGVKLRDLGCIVCLDFFETFTPTEIHHIDGKTKPGCHKLTIGLCVYHHRVKSNVQQWFSLHGDGPAVFEDAYMSQWELLELTNGLINE